MLRWRLDYLQYRCFLTTRKMPLKPSIPHTVISSFLELLWLFWSCFLWPLSEGSNRIDGSKWLRYIDRLHTESESFLSYYDRLTIAMSFPAKYPIFFIGGLMRIPH